MEVLAVVLGGPALVLVAFCFYLIFCTFVVIHTGDTKGLRDVATAMRAFGAIGTFRSLRRSRRLP
jgi:hypothetical protein